jgi:hypothetical protein
MFPPKSVFFSNFGDDRRPVLSQEVEIVVGYAEGPRPRHYCPSDSFNKPTPANYLCPRRDKL